ncbi:MAG: ABC transporter substrate-binding protein [Actinomycetales bacterium]
MRRFLPAVAAIALVLAAGVPAAQAAADDPVVLTIGINEDIDSANPFTGLSSLAYEVATLQYPTLTQYAAEDFSIVPGLAESWEESSDQKTWTYRLRPGMKWSDGTPLTAEDVAYTLNRIIDGKYEKTNFGSYVESMVRAEVVDDLTVRVEVSRPSPVMDHLFIFIIPKHIWESIDGKEVRTYENVGTPQSPTVGSGPYVMVERQPGQFTRLKANPNWWGGQRPVDEIIFKVYNNPDALGQALKAGEVDFAQGLDLGVYESLQGIPEITTVSAKPASFSEVAFNTGAALQDGTPIGDGNPLLKDKALRQALNWAVDRQTLVDKVLGGQGQPGSTVIPPLYTQWHLDPSNPYTYDPATAARLLDAAGYRLGPDGVRADAKGNRLSFVLTYRTDEPASQKSSEFVQAYFKDVGVELTLKSVSEDALYEVVGQGNFDMFEWGWGVEPDPNYMLSTFTCGARSYEDGGTVYANLSDSFFCDPEYDRLFDAQAKETDFTKRQSIVERMQQMLYDDAPYLVTYYANGLQAYRNDRFTGWVSQPTQDGTLIYQWGSWSYFNVQPVSASGSASGSASASASPQTAQSQDPQERPQAEAQSNGIGVGLLLPVLAGAAVIVLIIIVVVRRRGADSRE